MFSISSRDLYILSDRELNELRSHPAYEEWIGARCSIQLSRQEQYDYVTLQSGDTLNGVSEGYKEYLVKKTSEYKYCKSSVRWTQFTKTVDEYLLRVKTP